MERRSESLHCQPISSRDIKRPTYLEGRILTIQTRKMKRGEVDPASNSLCNLLITNREKEEDVPKRLLSKTQRHLLEGSGSLKTDIIWDGKSWPIRKKWCHAGERRCNSSIKRHVHTQDDEKGLSGCFSTPLTVPVPILIKNSSQMANNKLCILSNNQLCDFLRFFRFYDFMKD